MTVKVGITGGEVEVLDEEEDWEEEDWVEVPVLAEVVVVALVLVWMPPLQEMSSAPQLRTPSSFSGHTMSDPRQTTC
jgi:hypothetical protein